jgi:hypothetical protein
VKLFPEPTILDRVPNVLIARVEISVGDDVLRTVVMRLSSASVGDIAGHLGPAARSTTKRRLNRL